MPEDRTPPYKEYKGEEGDGSDFTSQGHEAGPRDISSEERGGVSDTDLTPSDPHGVGDAKAPGNEQMLGTSEEERREARKAEGVAAAPDMQYGDQGG